MIKLEKISKRHEQKQILDEISLDIKSSQRVVILGKSGSGKTTLLRLIAGLETPEHGCIYIDSKLASKDGKIIIPPYKRGIGMVFQNLALWSHMNVFENISFGLKMQKVDKRKIKEQVKEMLKIMQLEGYENKNIQNLSGGEQQRVALARALITAPKVLLMDEPLSSLNIELSSILLNEILNLQKSMGFTLIYVTHSQREAKSLATQIIKIENSKIVM